MRSENAIRFINICRNQITNQEKNKPHNYKTTVKNLNILQQIAILKDCGRCYTKVLNE